MVRRDTKQAILDATYSVFVTMGQDGFMLILSVIIESALCMGKYSGANILPLTEKVEKSIYLILDNLIGGLSDK